MFYQSHLCIHTSTIFLSPKFISFFRSKQKPSCILHLGLFLTFSLCCFSLPPSLLMFLHFSFHSLPLIFLSDVFIAYVSSFPMLALTRFPFVSLCHHFSVSSFPPFIRICFPYFQYPYPSFILNLI